MSLTASTFTYCHSGDQIKIMRWVGRVTLWGTGELHTGFWWGDLRGGDHLEDLGIDGRIILKRIIKKWN